MSLDDNPMRSDLVQVHAPVPDSFSLTESSTFKPASSLTSVTFTSDASQNIGWARAERDTTLGVDLSVYATTCTFYTSFLPPFHSAPADSSSLLQVDRDGPELSPILDTGATHTMLPLSWLPDGQSKEAKKIHLILADGSKVRALLHNNLIYAHMAQRPLVSVGQLKAMLDIRFMWDDAYPLLLFCSAGKKYVLLKAKVIHQLPVITSQELLVLLSAIHARTTCGEFWDKGEWRSHMGRDFDLYSGLTSPPFPPMVYDNDNGQMQELEDQPILLSSISLPSGPQPGAYNLEDNDAIHGTQQGVIHENSCPPNPDPWSSESINNGMLHGGVLDEVTFTIQILSSHVSNVSMPTCSDGMNPASSLDLTLSTKFQNDTPEDETKEIQDDDSSEETTSISLPSHPSQEGQLKEDISHPLSTYASDGESSLILSPLRSEAASPDRPAPGRNRFSNAIWAAEDPNDQGSFILCFSRSGTTTPNRPRHNKGRHNNSSWARDDSLAHDHRPGGNLSATSTTHSSR